MAINNFKVSYDDFELGEIIQPDEFDINNREIVERINTIIAVLNQITDSIGGIGGDIISIAPVAPFIPDKLQQFLEQLVEKLRSSGVDGGSKFIGAVPVTGVEGSNIYEQITSLKALLEGVRTHFTNEIERLDVKVEDVDIKITANNLEVSKLNGKVTSLEGALNDFDGEKVSVHNVYTRTQMDNKLTPIESNISALISGKTAKTGDHEGTWQGMNMSDLGNVIGISKVDIRTTRPSSPIENMLWYNPLTQQYRIYKDGQFRANGYAMNIDKIENRVSISTKSSSVEVGISEFNKNFDDVMVFKNSIFIAEGEEYNVSPDSKRIDKISGEWDKDTIFDFIVLTSVPVVSDFRVEDFVRINTNEDARVVEEGKRVSLYNQIKAEYESGALKGADGLTTAVKVGTTTYTQSGGTVSLPAYPINTDTTYTAGANVVISGTNVISATDTKYTHPTTAGNKHIPTGGTVGQILTNTASGTAKWDDLPSGGGEGSAIPDIGTFNSEQEIITYIIMNQLESGLYRTGIGDASDCLLILHGWSSYYEATVHAPDRIVYVSVTRDGQILDMGLALNSDLQYLGDIASLENIVVDLENRLYDLENK